MDNKSFFSRIIDGLSTLFGGLDYTRHKIPDFEYTPEPPTMRFDEYEYLFETTKIDSKWWNKRCLEGWEMVQIDRTTLEVIWKRKIN